MSGNGNQVPLAPSQRGPGPYPRASTPHRPECYHTSGATGGAYMPNATGAQAALTLRGQAAPQPSAPPAPQQDMSKTTMAGQSYVTPQNQTPQARPQYPNFQYRASQHGSRPNTHPRQQQPYMGSGGATAAGPVVYHHPLVFQQPHMTIPQTYQQPRSTTPGYYPYMTQYISYTTPTNPGPYYYTNGQQLPAGSVGATPAGRGAPGALVPQPAPAAPAAPLPHPQPQPHIHPPIPGIRQVPPKRTSHRVPIINPVTQQDIFSEIYSNDSQNVSGESSERQTPQPEKTHSVVEEFSRKVNEVANQPSASETASKNSSKNIEVPATTASPTQPHTNAIISNNNNNIVKSELNINESKNLGPDVAEVNETPVVSAISDSPVVVPKLSVNIKQLQKSSEHSQPLAIDNKNLQNKQQKKNKPFVPQDELEKNDSSIVPSPPAPVEAESANANTSQALPTSVVSPTLATPAPQPQRTPRERVRSEDKKKESQEKETPKPNGPTSVEISSVDSLPDAINPPTSQINQAVTEAKATKQLLPATETESSNLIKKSEVVINKEYTFPSKQLPTATELLSASIEKVAAKEQSPETDNSNKDESSAIQAQAKLAQSIASVARSNPEPKMKDINLNNKSTDPDTANGNATVETVKDESNKNEKSVKNTKNSNKKAKMANTEASEPKAESYENGKEETDKLEKIEQENATKEEEPSETTEKPAENAPPVFVPKYKYSDDQWSPLNTAGKKCYDIDLLMQIKEDPLSKNKPNVPLLEACNVMRSTPIQEPMIFNPISRPMNDAFFPNFLKIPGPGSRSNVPKETKKESRSMAQSSKGSVKLSPAVSSSGAHKPVIHVSLSLREEVKLNQTKDAWKPSRLKKDSLTEEEAKTQELYKKFRGILNKLTPQKFDTLLDKVKTLDIDTQSRLEGVINLVFEKAIDEPNFSEAYAAMCSKLSMIKVPSNNDPNTCVNFRGLIINRCQSQFVAEKVDEQVQKLEKEISECTDPVKKKELLLQLEEENRRVRMRSVGNVRFIGELYKLKMLTSKIMVYCMNHLVEKLEEEKLECLCKLLTTIGEQVESEAKEQLESVFKKMQDIVDRKSNKISSRVRFMIQDVIELRRRKWVVKNVVDSQPKKMDQIQKEAEQQQRQIELMNANPGGYRREEGGRGKRGDGRRQGAGSFMDGNSWKAPRTSYTVDTSKLKAVTGTPKNLSNVKLAPSSLAWNHGSGTKNIVQASSNSQMSLSKNPFSMLANMQADPTSLRTNKDLSPSYQHSKSIERSTFNSRGDFNSGSGSRSGSVGVPRSSSGSRGAPAPAAAEPAAPAPQEPLPDDKRDLLKTLVAEHLTNPNDEESATEMARVFPPQYHANTVAEILNLTIDKSAKDIQIIVKLLLHMVTTNVISSENFIAGMTETIEIAPDLYIDIPMLYEYLAKLIAPQLEKKYITFNQTFRLCENIISSNHGHILLKHIIRNLKESMGPTFVKTKWDESGLHLKDWMSEDQVSKWIEDNKFEFLEGGTSEETKKIMTPSETQSKLLQLMNAEENCECIRGWVKDNLGASSNEDWFMRALSQAICEYSLYGSESRDVPHFSQERMNKYSALINDFGESREKRESSCLFGIQQLIHRLEHPQGLTLEIFQYLHEQYIISVDGFIAWEVSEKEPEGKAVMLKALTSFFTNIKEADNEDSCSED